MGYIKTVTIMSGVTSASLGTIYENIVDKIASVTGWTKSDTSVGLLVGTDSKQLRINFSTYGSNSIFGYSIHSQNNNGNVYFDGYFINANQSYDNLYLHYCKSKSGKTIGIGVSNYSTPTIEFIIAEDANGDFSAIGLNAFWSNDNNSDFGAQMIWNGYKCKLSNTMKGSYNYGALQPVISTTISTSVCKLPNFLSNCMFKEAFMILSLPINLSQMGGVVLDIGGKKYQGCYSYEITSSSKEDKNTLAILVE